MAKWTQGNVFKHHQTVSADDIDVRLISGYDGAFREHAREEGINVEEPTVWVVVMFNVEGQLEGAKLTKCGKVKPAIMNTKDVWLNAPEGKLVIPEFDLSEFGDEKGYMTSRYAELVYKVKVKQGEQWKSIKKGELEQRGYGAVVFRCNFLPVAVDRMKFVVTLVLGELKTLTATYGQDVTSRGFPGIRVHEGRARLISPEEREQRFGLGLQPLYHVRDAPLDAQGGIDTSTMAYPTSEAIKKAVSLLLQSATLPNWHWKRGHYDDAVRTKKFDKRVPGECWPTPRAEDNLDTEESEGSESEGEQWVVVMHVACRKVDLGCV